jgi:hypothetical protein
MIEGGPMSQPTLHPVAAKDSGEKDEKELSGSQKENSLPADPTVTVRSHIPGSVAMRMCSLLSKTKQSYWYKDVEWMHTVAE